MQSQRMCKIQLCLPNSRVVWQRVSEWTSQHGLVLHFAGNQLALQIFQWVNILLLVVVSGVLQETTAHFRTSGNLPYVLELNWVREGHKNGRAVTRVACLSDCNIKVKVRVADYKVVSVLNKDGFRGHFEVCITDVVRTIFLKLQLKDKGLWFKVGALYSIFVATRIVSLLNTLYIINTNRN